MAISEIYLSDDHDNLERFISYYYQASLVKKLNIKSVLEIGVGNKAVSNYLRQCGFVVTTCDHDAALKPEIIADIRSLPMTENSFDVVLACEILEHLPWKDVPEALRQVHRVSRKYAIVSVPWVISILLSFVFLHFSRIIFLSASVISKLSIIIKVLMSIFSLQRANFSISGR